MKPITFDNFPWWMVAVSNAVGLSLYGIGFYLMSRLGTSWAVLYALYCLWMEWRLLSGSCRSCYYYGKRCAFGKGVACSWFFDKGGAPALSTKRITWLDIVPDFLVFLVPLCAGIALLMRSFSWPILLLVVTLAILGTAGNGSVRSRIACKYCRQRELGCAAEQLFSKSAQA